MSPELLEIACTCCTPPCPPYGICPGTLIQRTACGGSQWAIVADFSGGYTSAWVAGSRSRARATLTLSTPSIAPGIHAGTQNPFGRYAWSGFYERITIAGESYEFDGTFGTGVAVTHDAELAPGSDAGGMLDAETVRIESLVDLESGSGGGTIWSIGGGGGVFVDRAWHGSSDSGGTTAYYAFGESVAAAAGFYNVDGSGPQPPLCSGTGQSGDLKSGTSTIGGWSAQVVNPASISMSAEQYGARTCPCAIGVGGSLWVQARTDTGKPVAPGAPPYLTESVYVEPTDETEGGWTDPEPMTADKLAWVEATIDARIVRNAPAGCNYPSATWQLGSTPATLSVGGVGYPVTQWDVKRVGPRLYSVDVTIEGVESNDGDGSNVDTGTQSMSLYVVVDGDCPKGVQSTRQFAQAYAYQHGPSGVPNATTTYAPVNPSVTGKFTENAIAMEEVARVVGDPGCGCHEVGDYDGEGDDDAVAMVQGVLDQGDA